MISGGFRRGGGGDRFAGGGGGGGGARKASEIGCSSSRETSASMNLRARLCFLLGNVTNGHKF